MTFHDEPGICLQCGQKLDPRALSAYCSMKCRLKDEDYWERKALQRKGKHAEPSR